MQKEDSYYRQLLSGFIENTLSLEQVEELLEFIHREPLLYSRLLNDPGIQGQLSGQAYNSDIHISEALSERMRSRLMAVVDEPLVVPATLEQQAPIRRIFARWWYAAAAIFILLGTGAYFLF